MSPRTPTCGQPEASQRLRDARGHLELAELPDSNMDPGVLKAAASSAILAGIAAADAACCAALGRRSRSQDHRDAVELVKRVAPGGANASNQLRRLLALKDEAQYGFGELTFSKHQSTVRWARALVEFAERIVHA